jgi:hypothetical protein
VPAGERSQENVPTAINAPPQAALGAVPICGWSPARHFHFSFRAGLMTAASCRDAIGFVRKLAHKSFNHEVVRFFQAKLI